MFKRFLTISTLLLVLAQSAALFAATPNEFFYWAATDQASRLKQAIAQGFNVNTPNSKGQTPLDVAKGKSVEVLRNAGGKKSSELGTPLVAPAVEIEEKVEPVAYAEPEVLAEPATPVEPVAQEETKKPEPAMQRGAVEITSAAQFDSIVAAGGLVVVDFYATWCGPCKRLKPLFKQVATAYGDSAQFVMVDVDKRKALAERYSVRSLPTLVYIKDGNKVASTIGLQTVNALKTKIDNLLK